MLLNTDSRIQHNSTIISSPACLLILNFYTALDVPLLDFNTSVLKKKGIRTEKHLQCEKLLGLAGGNTKKHGNKKSEDRGSSHSMNDLEFLP